MSCSAVTPPFGNVFVSPLTETTASARHTSCSGGRWTISFSASTTTEKERDPEQCCDEVRGPQVLGREDVVLVEVEDRAAEPVLDRRGQLADDRADHARRRGDPERGEEVGKRRREPQSPGRSPIRSPRRTASARSRPGSADVQASDRVHGDGEERQVGGDHRHAEPVGRRPAGDLRRSRGRPPPSARCARIGIVCDATTYGITPRCSTRNWAITAPSENPTTRAE